MSPPGWVYGKDSLHGWTSQTRHLAGAALFTRVMAADAFKSNAGAIVAQGVAGTGEGYAFTVW